MLKTAHINELITNLSKAMPELIAGLVVDIDGLIIAKQSVKTFDEELIAARKKSYRRALGEQETFSTLEQILILFDSDKQSLNNREAMKRRYGNINDYLALAFGVHLPNLD